ncbi:hypothetical protein N0V84_005124 [Fusarium piperis]|uniref:Erythromycin biosynthesis protein CIII-like C-terminal domain-containing protein n=1 Tax=Fusarium piperis TaxID=1435070 RepID=A0A9W8WEB9_9HYPO|nr:hypothetical protein N0V84_005124 [Fusarium piperis]
MFKRLLLGSVLIAALALLFAQGSPQLPTPIQGRNKTALFLVNEEHGLSNVHIATASALLEKHPDIEVHFASFPKIESKLERISYFARRHNPESRGVVFHKLSGPSYAASIHEIGKSLDNIPHPPGMAGIEHLCKDMQIWISPWSAEDHFSLYQELQVLIDEIDPAVVVLDTLFRPGIDAARDKNRLHAIISPNTVVDNFLGDQPYGSMFWKYPAISSGFDFPVPWRNLAENIYLNMRFIYSVVMTPGLSAKRKILREKGLKDPINFFSIYRQNAPWISMTTEGATIPVDYIPPNVTLAGPIVVSAAPAEEQDPKLVEWLKKAPTLLVNLGSTVSWSERQASIMGQALTTLLDKTNVQVLWKFNKHGDYSDDLFTPLKPHLDSGRLRVEKWLTIDPASLLASGYIAASVHHGGANCYNEAIHAGVPHIIIPLWADLYGYAALAENIGVGVWACRGTNPDWTVDHLSQSLLKVLDGGEASLSMREKAKKLAEKIHASGEGREIAAKKVAELAYVASHEA